MHRDYTYFLKKNRKKRRKRNEIISCSKPNKFVRKQSMRKLDQTICTEQAFLPFPPPPFRLAPCWNWIYDHLRLTFYQRWIKGKGRGDKGRRTPPLSSFQPITPRSIHRQNVSTGRVRNVPCPVRVYRLICSPND